MVVEVVVVKIVEVLALIRASLDKTGISRLHETYFGVSED